MAEAGEGSARPRAGHILRRVLEDAEEEITRTSSGLEYLQWLVAAVLGNALGGVVIVALLNYGQVMAGGGRRGDGRRASA
jgi:hypothetical protein